MNNIKLIIKQPCLLLWYYQWKRLFRSVRPYLMTEYLVLSQQPLNFLTLIKSYFLLWCINIWCVILSDITVFYYVINVAWVLQKCPQIYRLFNLEEGPWISKQLIIKCVFLINNVIFGCKCSGLIKLAWFLFLGGVN